MKAQPSTKDLVRPVGRSSAVWQHFKVEFPQGSHPGVAVCDWCHKDVQHGSSTSNLASHLRVRHPQVVAGTDLAIPPPCLGANRKPRTRKPKAENLQTLFEDAFLKWAVATGESPDLCADKNFTRMIALLNSKVKVPTREKLEMAFKLRESSVNVDMVLLSDPIAPVSWVAAIMTTLKHALRSQSGTAAANATRLQMEDIVRRWGGPEDATNGFPSLGPDIPS
eukprot:15928-Heterococcus_DN1.PRE.1